MTRRFSFLERGWIKDLSCAKRLDILTYLIFILESNHLLGFLK